MTTAAPFFNASADSAREAGLRLLAELERSDGDISAAKLLNLMGTNVDYDVTSEKGETPLLLAAQKGFFVAALRMVGYGADVNKPDQFRFTPFMMAASGKTAHWLMRCWGKMPVSMLSARRATRHLRSRAGRGMMRC